MSGILPLDFKAFMSFKRARRAARSIGAGLSYAIELIARALPPAPLVGANIILRRDYFCLTPHQRERFLRSARLASPISLPPGSLSLGMTAPRRRNMVVSFAETKPHLRLIADLPTFLFINETIRLKKRLEDTDLYKQALSGVRIRRQNSADGKKSRAQLATKNDLCGYHDRCMGLAESINRNGVVSLDSVEGSKFRSKDGYDKDIGVAIDEDGRFVHYRRGKHRLAIAQALGTDRVPVLVHFISGTYLLKFIRRRDVLMPGWLRSGISQAIDEAVTAACRDAMQTAQGTSHSEIEPRPLARAQG